MLARVWARFRADLELAPETRASITVEKAPDSFCFLYSSSTTLACTFLFLLIESFCSETSVLERRCSTPTQCTRNFFDWFLSLRPSWMSINTLEHLTASYHTLSLKPFSSCLEYHLLWISRVGYLMYSPSPCSAKRTDLELVLCLGLEGKSTMRLLVWLLRSDMVLCWCFDDLWQPV